MMLCKDCNCCDLCVLELGKSGGIMFFCNKHGIYCDTTHFDTRQCIKEDCDVIWRAAKEKGSRYDG